MNILVVGGAGYIGSHMVRRLLDDGHGVVVADNLSTGFADALPEGVLKVLDLADRPALHALFDGHAFDGVMHFASFIQVGESVSSPAKYYANNLANTLHLLDAMVEHDVRRFIFSSSAAVYGEPRYTPLDEAHPCAPINPYGRSKWMVEQILSDYDSAYGLKSVSLRYFNAAGADPRGGLGERHDPETHLIPLVLQAASGRRESICVYGRDYATADGTCIRDYIHVADLCQAHLLALESLTTGGGSAAYNLGNGNGFSVQQVIEAAEAVTGRKIPVAEGAPRPGDPAVLVADASRAWEWLGWEPVYADLSAIIEHAWAWEQKMANGK